MDKKKNSNNTLEKAFFYTLTVLSLIGVLCPKLGNMSPDIGHIRYKKNREFTADFKNPNLPQRQNAPQKGKIKTPFLKSKFGKVPFFVF